MKPSAVLDVLLDLSYGYPNTKLPDDQEGMKGLTRVWHEVLGEIEDEFVWQAAKQWIKTEQWFPAPAQIRKAAIRLQTGMPIPAQAWNDVVATVNSRDPERWKATHAVAISALRDIGGPQVITLATDLPRVRESFLKAYDSRVQELFNKPSTNYTLPGQSIADTSRARIQAIAGGED